MNGLTCPSCAGSKSRVVETRRIDDGIRRIRLCMKCGKSFSTYEGIRKERLYVVKRNGTRQLFDREKLRLGLELAFTKSTVDEAKIDDITDRIVNKIQSKGLAEVTSEYIGNLVLGELTSSPDYHVAYVRFASVFLSVTDPQKFEDLVYNIREKLTERPSDKS